MTIFIGAMLPAIAVIVFIGGIVYQIYKWMTLATPKMTLFPAPKPGAERFLEVIKETFFFKSLFLGDKTLWLFGWVFHIMLAFIFLGHFRVFSWLPDKMLSYMGMTKDNIDSMSLIGGGLAGIVVVAAILFLMCRRFVLKRVRQVSTGGDYFALLLIVCILLTGDAMRFHSHFELNAAREYFRGLVTFSSCRLPDNGWFIVHYCLALLLFMYIPFSKILHFGGIFFTKAALHKH